jgi:arginine repressor
MTKLFANLTLKTLDLLVLKYIKSNPGRRLYEINSETLRSHHSWGTKHIVERLEQQHRVAVIRTQHGKKVAPRYYACI